MTETNLDESLEISLLTAYLEKEIKHVIRDLEKTLPSYQKDLEWAR
jgi:hypothetical protein